MILLSSRTVDLNESEGHSNVYQIFEFSDVYHQTGFEIYWFINV